MLKVELTIKEDGITVPYPSFFNENRDNHGFIDIRGRPDLAVAISEASHSPALKSLLVSLADPRSLFFTIGCDLGSHEEPWSHEKERSVSGGYVQIMHTLYAGKSPEDYIVLSNLIEKSMKLKSKRLRWYIYSEIQFVLFKLDQFSAPTPSLSISFFATARNPELALSSREIFIDGLRESLGTPHPSGQVPPHP